MCFLGKCESLKVILDFTDSYPLPLCILMYYSWDSKFYTVIWLFNHVNKHILYLFIYIFSGKKKFGSTQALFAKIKFKLSDFGKHQYIAIYACLRHVLVLANHDFYDADSWYKRPTISLKETLCFCTVYRHLYNLNTFEL